MTYTKEQKKEYFSNLRKQWQDSKALAENDKVSQAVFNEQGLKVSYFSYYFTLLQMRKLQLDGIPYIDCKTFKKWQESGYIVKKGEKSKISGITWISNDEDNDEKFIYPKQYNLFHKSQVTEL